MTNLPALEEIIPAEKLATIKKEIEANAVNAFQPMLDRIVAITGLNEATKAETTAQVDMALVADEVGQPTITNNVVLNVAFTPEHPRDIFDNVQRTIVKEMFGKALADAKA